MPIGPCYSSQHET